LFAAAANGVMVGRGLLGAYGRLAAWRSVAGLVGAGEGEGVEAVAAVAEHCRWAYFDTASWWLEHVGWDIGLAVVRPDGLSLAVLAATDIG
jgi:hypothetical protein